MKKRPLLLPLLSILLLLLISFAGCSLSSGTPKKTESATESAARETAKATEAATEGKTVAKTEPATEAMTEAAPPTVQPTEAKTEPVTEPATEPVTAQPTEAKTEAATEPATEAATEAKTEPSTDPATEAATAPATLPPIDGTVSVASEPLRTLFVAGEKYDATGLVFANEVNEETLYGIAYLVSPEVLSEGDESVTVTVGNGQTFVFPVTVVPGNAVGFDPIYSDKDYEALCAEGLAEFGVDLIVEGGDARNATVYTNMLENPAPDGVVSSREELIDVVNYFAFYRAKGVTVRAEYPIDDVEEELNYLYRNSGFLPSLCSIEGAITPDGYLQIVLRFYPERYIVPRVDSVSPIYAETSSVKGNGTDLLPGIDPENGISVYDSEQAVYVLTHGGRIAPIQGSPAEETVEAAVALLREIADETMSEKQLLYNVYLALINRAAYDYSGDVWAGKVLDPVRETDMLGARLTSFRAEGPILYGSGVCFGFAKASALLLGLEGFDVRRTVGFYEDTVGRSGFVFKDGVPGEEISIHSFCYVRLADGFDYLFDPVFATAARLNVNGDVIEIYRAFSIGLSCEEHRKTYLNLPLDPIASSPDYNPGNFSYLTELTYDGEHDYIIDSVEEFDDYTAYLLANVFSGEPAYRSLTIFLNVDFATYAGEYYNRVYSFCDATGVPYRFAAYTDEVQGVEYVQVLIAFGK